MERVRVGIINVTGYIGIDLARILCQHPGVELVSVTGRSAVGEKLGNVFPHMAEVNLVIEPELGDVDLAFAALPHGASAEAVARTLERDIKVIDVSGDFRFNDVEQYQRWYNVVHPAPELLSEAVYGLPELYRAQISEARLIGNPGCYPTSAVLAMTPALREELIDLQVIIDSKSGISGAGRSLKLHTHYAEANENVSAYGLQGHRHMPEIAQELSLQANGNPVSVTFVPHLIPMTRGMLSTCYAKLRKPIDIDEICQIYRDFYHDEQFVRIVDNPPQTKQALGSNTCLIYSKVDPSGQYLIVISCIDNLVKGGAGQAVQNMNLMLGYPEGMGLGNLAIYP